MIDSRNISPDRLIAAFMAPIHRLDQFARKAAMEQRTERIRNDVTEVRQRELVDDCVKLDSLSMLDDIEFLLQRIEELEIGYRETRKVVAQRTLEARKAGEVNVAHKLTISTMTRQISTMTRQITNAMAALTTAGVRDVGGELTSRLARRIEELAKKELSKNNALEVSGIRLEATQRNFIAAQEVITEVHKALDEAEVPKHNGITLGERLKPAIEGYLRDEVFRRVVTASGLTSSRVLQDLQTLMAKPF